MRISKEEHYAIDSLRFVCMIFLVLLHTQVGHLVPGRDAIADDMATIENLSKIPFLQFLFILSGYLFFVGLSLDGDKQMLTEGYKNKLTRRFWSLLIPYLIWCSTAILYNHFIKGTPWPHGSQWITWYWDAGEGHPIGKAMWYIKSLIIFSLLAPLYFITVRFFRHFTLVVVMFLFTFNAPVDFPYFNVDLLLGSYLCLCEVPLKKVADSLNWKMCLVAYVILKIAFCCLSVPVGGGILVLTGFVGLYGLFSQYRIPAFLTATSSFVYFAHPYFTGIRNILVTSSVSGSIVLLCLAWLVTFFLDFSICITLYYLLRKFVPRILGIVTGGRG